MCYRILSRCESFEKKIIFNFTLDEINLTHSPSRRISSTAGGYHIEDISPVPAGMDIIENRQVSVETCRFFIKYVDNNDTVSKGFLFFETLRREKKLS